MGATALIHVADIQRGDALVFEQVYLQYHERYYFYVLKRTSSEDIAKEVVQLAFIKLWERRQHLSQDLPIGVQIARIVRTVLIDVLRKKATEKKWLRHIEGEAVTTAEPLMEKELHQRINQIVEQMPPVCRQVYKMSREEELSHKEIARQLSISPKSVENHIAKALKLLRRHLTMLFFF